MSFGDWGILAVGVQQVKKGDHSLVRGYLPIFQAQLLDLAALSLWLRQDALCMEVAEPIINWQFIDEQDWASSWKQYWLPQEIGDRFLINPAWYPAPSNCDR